MVPETKIMIAIIAQKPQDSFIKGMPTVVFIPKMPAISDSGKTIPENMVKVLMISFNLKETREVLVSSRASIISFWPFNISQMLLV